MNTKNDASFQRIKHKLLSKVKKNKTQISKNTFIHLDYGKYCTGIVSYHRLKEKKNVVTSTWSSGPGLEAHLDPLWHGVGQLLHEGDGEILDPHHLNCPLQQRQCRDVGNSLEPRLDDCPQVLNRIEIRRVARPIHDADLLLLQQVHDLPAGVTGGAILEELCCLQPLHPGEQLLLQHLYVAVPIHCYLWWEKVEGAPSPLAAEASPDHTAGGMLNVNNDIALFVMIHGARPPGFLRTRIDEPEGGFVREHNALPVFFSPGPVVFFIQKVSHFLTILAVRRGFLAAHLEGNPSLFWHMCWIVLTDMSAKPGTSPLTSLAVLKRWRRIKCRSLSSCAKFVFRGLPERFLGGVGVADSGRSLWIRMFFAPYQHSARAFPQSPSA